METKKIEWVEENLKFGDQIEIYLIPNAYRPSKPEKFIYNNVRKYTDYGYPQTYIILDDRKNAFDFDNIKDIVIVENGRKMSDEIKYEKRLKKPRSGTHKSNTDMAILSKVLTPTVPTSPTVKTDVSPGKVSKKSTVGKKEREKVLLKSDPKANGKSNSNGKEFFCSCGKSYPSRGGVWNHQKKTGHKKA